MIDFSRLSNIRVCSRKSVNLVPGGETSFVMEDSHSHANESDFQNIFRTHDSNTTYSPIGHPSFMETEIRQ